MGSTVESNPGQLWDGGPRACLGVAQSGYDHFSFSFRTIWTWLRPRLLIPCFMMMASQRRRRPWWTGIMLPSLEPFLPRGLKTNSMVEFHIHLLDSSHVILLSALSYSLYCFLRMSLVRMKPKSAPNLSICKCLTLHPFTCRHFYKYVFCVCVFIFKGCENKCNCDTALLFKT